MERLRKSLGTAKGSGARRAQTRQPLEERHLEERHEEEGAYAPPQHAADETPHGGSEARAA